MAFCRECGNELEDGTKFCPNCGTGVEVKCKASENMTSDELSGCNMPANGFDENGKNISANEVCEELDNVSGKKGIISSVLLSKMSKFFGILLLILAIVDFHSDPPIFTIILSIAIIVGGIFCLAKKYKLKGFTIAAIIVALVCLWAGIGQGKSLGFTRIPGKYDYSRDNNYSPAAREEAVGDRETAENEEARNKDDDLIGAVKAENSDNSGIETTENDVQENIREDIDEESMETEHTDITEGQTSASESDTVPGVDPELKAFLDSYEEFVDEYVAFMKNYLKNPGNVISMLNDYTDIMNKAEEFDSAVNKYDSSEMSTEDAKYYLEVTTRCTQKMLDIY